MRKNKVFSTMLCLVILIVSACGAGGGGGAAGTSPTVSSAKAITAFSFTHAANSTLPTNIAGTITGTAISVTLPYGVSRTSLVATFSTTGTSVRIGSTIQINGVTANNFTNPVTYTVTAVDGTTQNYTVTVTNASGSAKDITAFSILGVSGTISDPTISLTLPYGTDLTSLVATYSTTGASVRVGSTTQTSGVTPNNFASAVTYTVVAQDSSTKDYIVTVTVAPPTATLTWGASPVDATHGAADSYVVFSCTTPSGTCTVSSTPTATVTGLLYTTPALSSGVHCFGVKAYNTAGYSLEFAPCSSGNCCKPIP